MISTKNSLWGQIEAYMEPFFHEFHNNDHYWNGIGLSLAMEDKQLVRELLENPRQVPLVGLTEMVPHVGLKDRRQ